MELRLTRDLLNHVVLHAGTECLYGWPAFNSKESRVSRMLHRYPASARRLP
jgi:hypothetical protein